MPTPGNVWKVSIAGKIPHLCGVIDPNWDKIDTLVDATHKEGLVNLVYRHQVVLAMKVSIDLYKCNEASSQTPEGGGVSLDLCFKRIDVDRSRDEAVHQCYQHDGGLTARGILVFKHSCQKVMAAQGTQAAKLWAW